MNIFNCNSFLYISWGLYIIRMCFWRISVKALQAMLLRLELCTRVFISGCLRGSLEKAHSFSNLNAPWRPMLVCSLRRRHFFFNRLPFIYNCTMGLQRHWPRGIITWSAHLQTLWCWQEWLFPRSAWNCVLLSDSSGLNWVVPDWLETFAVINHRMRLKQGLTTERAVLLFLCNRTEIVLLGTDGFWWLLLMFLILTIIDTLFEYSFFVFHANKDMHIRFFPYFHILWVMITLISL